MKYIISVGEPWDFNSPDGENIIKGSLEIKSEKFAIFRLNYEIELKQIRSNILILHPRYENENFYKLKNNSVLTINAGIISPYEYNNLLLDEVNAKAIFVIVGTLRKIGN